MRSESHPAVVWVYLWLEYIWETIILSLEVTVLISLPVRSVPQTKCDASGMNHSDILAMFNWLHIVSLLVAPSAYHMKACVDDNEIEENYFRCLHDDVLYGAGETVRF